MCESYAVLPNGFGGFWVTMSNIHSYKSAIEMDVMISVNVSDNGIFDGPPHLRIEEWSIAW